MVKAFFLDFYGTIVHEDGEVIKKITQIIMKTGKAGNTSEIDIFWWKEFQNMFINSYGKSFETQRALEERALENTIKKFHSSANAQELSKYMFEYWMKPPIFEDSKPFFDKSPIPIYIVSNIDTADVMKAIEYHNIMPAGVFTSEDAKAYKPRKELFELALNRAGLKADEVIHIGDSISSDVRGANGVNIRALWLNRFDKEVPDGVESIVSLSDALERAILN